MRIHIPSWAVWPSSFDCQIILAVRPLHHNRYSCWLNPREARALSGEKYSIMPRQLLSSFAPPRWHSSMTMKSKKSGGYSPKYGDGTPSFGGPLMNVWKMGSRPLTLRDSIR